MCVCVLFLIALLSLRALSGWQDSNRAKRCCYAAVSASPGLQSGGDAGAPMNPLKFGQICTKKAARSSLGRCNAQHELDRPRSHHPDRRNRHRGSRKAHFGTHCLGKARATFVLSLRCVHFLTTCFAQLVCVKRSLPAYVLEHASQGLVTSNKQRRAFFSRPVKNPTAHSSKTEAPRGIYEQGRYSPCSALPRSQTFLSSLFATATPRAETEAGVPGLMRRSSRSSVESHGRTRLGEHLASTASWAKSSASRSPKPPCRGTCPSDQSLRRRPGVRFSAITPWT